jgi:GH15 family glucan-1,4-alpha-glucosidase
VSGSDRAIADYALLGNTRTAALVSKSGSVDWLCVPRFDSPACFAALLGQPEHGRWLLAPKGVMPLWNGRTDLVRVVRGLRGKVSMHMELVMRFGYGAIVPWVRRVDGELVATAGPKALALRSLVDTHGEDFTTVAEFTVSEGQVLPFVLTYFPSHQAPPLPIDANASIEVTEQWWRKWTGRCSYHGEWDAAVRRSLITLKALTYSPTGGIVAAPTTSLPEAPGGTRNWDYRYCWLRDATLTLDALLTAGYHEEAQAWREWLLRAVAGRPEDLQILYGIGGERHLVESEIDWLPGFLGSRPVRVGNAAATQFQLDVYGEIMDALHLSRTAGLSSEQRSWEIQRVLLDFIESAWEKPDEGIWEVRGPRRHFTHSKVMAWVAVDRAVKTVERFGLEGPVDRWRALRETIHRQVCQDGFDEDRGAFVQYYGTKNLDAALLMIPLVGFLPVDDERVRGTVTAIEKELTVDGLICRYATDGVDGLPPGEGVFLPCSFWLADNLAMLGREADARALFERLLGLANDVGLLAEEYDPANGCLLGNFPQAFTHVALINTARALCGSTAPGKR